MLVVSYGKLAWPDGFSKLKSFSEKGNLSGFLCFVHLLAKKLEGLRGIISD